MSIHDECIEWDEGTTSGGYGCFWDKELKRSVNAHRRVWEEERGPIPEGIFVLHMCDNPPCINVDHLFLGTARDNMRDMSSKQRGRNKYTMREEIERLEQKVAEQQREIERLKKVSREFIESLKDDDDIHDWSQCPTEKQAEAAQRKPNATAETPCIFATFEAEVGR